MAQSIGDMSNDDWNTFIGRFTDLLMDFDIAGSVGNYSLYTALHGEYDKAKTDAKDGTLDIEKALLGAMLLDGECIAGVRKCLPRFRQQSHRTIYNAICALNDNGEPADQVTVSEELSARGQLNDVGGAATIASLVGEMATSVNAEYHAKILATLISRTVEA
tara:strand:+ start:428 stop:913 length:486 start_codon:yes stop_codon:yes gene_type:complete